jgi:hypothetical protein
MCGKSWMNLLKECWDWIILKPRLKSTNKIK